jgi:hypothetical protein
MNSRIHVSTLVACLLASAPVSTAAEPAKSDFRYLLKDFTFATPIGPSGSTQNPDNVLGIPAFQLENESRLDAYFDYRALRLQAKPRLNLLWERWSAGPLSGESDTDVDFFVNEFGATVTPDERLFVSYGRENLQWGPSSLISPSNPFFVDNGQRNPKREVAGSDFAKLVWVPNATWTWSVIANLFEGLRLGRDRARDRGGEFERTYALKVDYTSHRKFASVIGSYREAGEDQVGEGLRIGGYAGWTATDALLLHVEASGAVRNDALYPEADPTAPLDFRMLPAKVGDEGWWGTVLAGGSYTFDIGPTVVFEYLHSREGYSAGEASDYYTLRRSAAEGLSGPPPISGAAAMTLGQTLIPGLRLQRQNYLMLQYQQPQIRNQLDLVFRYTLGIDDGSSQLISVVQYGLGDRILIFLVGAQNFGSIDAEARTLFDYAYSFGLEVTF